MGAVGGSWTDKSRCLTEDPEAFFNPDLEAEAKAVCARCPVRAECLTYALETRQDDGVWGGLTAEERIAHLQAVIPVEGDAPLTSITYTTRARSTGATCSAGRTPTGWGVACLTHGTRARAPSRTAAENAVSRPQEWCSGCRRIADGAAPKIPKESSCED